MVLRSGPHLAAEAIFDVGGGGNVALERLLTDEYGMQDYKKHLEKLRTDSAECRLISDLATDRTKRDLFDKLAAHLSRLADQVEIAMSKVETGK